MNYKNLIEKLAEYKILSTCCADHMESLSDGNYCMKCLQKNEGAKIPKPILIGDMLEKMRGKLFEPPNANIRTNDRLLIYWEKCGFTKSLQEIAEENVECFCFSNKGCDKQGCGLQPPALELFNFLDNLKL